MFKFLIRCSFQRILILADIDINEYSKRNYKKKQIRYAEGMQLILNNNKNEKKIL